MQNIKFDFNNMFAGNVGRAHGITDAEISKLLPAIQKAHKHLNALCDSPVNRVNLGLEWTALPRQDKSFVRRIQELGEEIATSYENVLSLGIGGSYLGLKAAQDALCPPYYNEFKVLRRNRAKIYFEGNNLDPTPLSVLLQNLDPLKTCVIVISKSGETTETKAVFEVVEAWLKKGVGPNYGRAIFAITDPKTGALRKKVNEEQRRDSLSFRNLSLMPGVGGRYSELNMGLLHLAIVGVDVAQVLAGAQAMFERCRTGSLYKNPAYLYAALHHLAYRKKGKPIAVLMPFTELLKSTADWYCQLMAESLGKKYQRKIKFISGGSEVWEMDTKREVCVGRTPVATRGTTDLHSIQQNNVEGENDKVVTMIRVERFVDDCIVPAQEGILAGKSFTELLKLAQESTEWALVRNNRPNCTITMPEISPKTWGGLLFFFEMATAFEGELLNINAFDQPGVESYKNYMYYKLNKPGLSEKIAQEIKKYPVKRAAKYIL